MANRHRVKLRFEDIIAKGDLAPDAPDGFRAQSPNGTVLWRGSGWNAVVNYDMPQVPFDATRPPGRSNRTGE